MGSVWSDRGFIFALPDSASASKMSRFVFVLCAVGYTTNYKAVTVIPACRRSTYNNLETKRFKKDETPFKAVSMLHMSSAVELTIFAPGASSAINDNG